MRKFLGTTTLAATAALLLAAGTLADTRVTDQQYVRHDGGSDAVIASCSSDATTPGPGGDAGGNRQANEPTVAIKPDDPSVIVAGANDYCTVPSFADSWEGVYVSANGGRTFTDSLLPGYPGDTSAEGQASPLFGPDTAAGDPLADWAGQSLYVGGIAFNRTVTTGATFLTNGSVFVATYKRDKTAPLGIDYLRTVIVGEGTPSAFFEGRFNDKPALVTDDWPGSPRNGNVYVSWTLFTGAGQDKILFSRSTDGGVTFSRPIAISKSVPNAQGSDVAVAPDGTIYVVWRQFGFPASGVDDAILFVKSTNGGRSFSDPAEIRPIAGYDRQDQYVTGSSARDCGDGAFLCATSFVFHRWDSLPQATVDRAGTVHVTWEQVTPAADNGDTYRPDGQSRVVVTQSKDGGATWIAPLAADPQPVGHQFSPNIEFDKAVGRLVLSYWDSRADRSYSVNRPPGNLADGTSVCGVPAPATCNVLNTFVATSTNGLVWTPTKVSSVGHQPEYELFGDRNDPFHGDYNWVDAAGGAVFSVWGDNRDVVPGSDPREATQDGFDVLQCRVKNPDGSFSADNCPNAGGLNQNIFGGSIR